MIYLYVSPHATNHPIVKTNNYVANVIQNVNSISVIIVKNAVKLKIRITYRWNVYETKQRNRLDLIT